MLEEDRRTLVRDLTPERLAERSTSLQPTYEDSVPPDADAEWELDDRS